MPAAIASRKFCFSWSESAQACPHWLPITVISSPVSSICSRRSRRMLVPCLSSGHCGQRETKETIVFLLGGLWRDCSTRLARNDELSVNCTQTRLLSSGKLWSGRIRANPWVRPASISLALHISEVDGISMILSRHLLGIANNTSSRHARYSSAN